jgi:hypothetical protein
MKQPDGYKKVSLELRSEPFASALKRQHAGKRFHCGVGQSGRQLPVERFDRDAGCDATEQTNTLRS